MLFCYGCRACSRCHRSGSARSPPFDGGLSTVHITGSNLGARKPLRRKTMRGRRASDGLAPHMRAYLRAFRTLRGGPAASPSEPAGGTPPRRPRSSGSPQRARGLSGNRRPQAASRKRRSAAAPVAGCLKMWRAEGSIRGGAGETSPRGNAKRRRSACPWPKAVLGRGMPLRLPWRRTGQ